MVSLKKGDKVRVIELLPEDEGHITLEDIGTVIFVDPHDNYFCEVEFLRLYYQGRKSYPMFCNQLELIK